MKKVGVSMDWFKSSRKKKTEDYEKDYLARYKKGENAKPKKKTTKQKKVVEEEFLLFISFSIFLIFFLI